MYFQNVSDGEFLGNLLLSDRQFNVTFKIKGNSPNSSSLFQAFNPEPFNVSSPNNNLTLNYSFDNGNSWTVLTIDVSTHAVSPTTAKAFEIVAALSANATFQALFTANVNSDQRGVTNYVQIQSLRPREQFKVYVSNGSAETILRFNKKAGVAELPLYFTRHTLANKSSFPDSVGMLQQLDPTTTVGQQIIGEAGLSHSVGLSSGSPIITTKNTAPFVVGDSVVIYDGTTTVSATINTITPNTSLTLSANWTGSTESGSLIDIHADYQLLRGRSGLFQFQNITVDGSDRTTQIIEYSAGAKVGDLAMITNYVYSGSNTQPSKVFQQPYVLTAGDLITPP